VNDEERGNEGGGDLCVAEWRGGEQSGGGGVKKERRRNSRKREEMHLYEESDSDRLWLIPGDGACPLLKLSAATSLSCAYPTSLHLRQRTQARRQVSSPRLLNLDVLRESGWSVKSKWNLKVREA
jgi:hypothetical protein